MNTIIIRLRYNQKGGDKHSRKMFIIILLIIGSSTYYVYNAPGNKKLRSLKQTYHCFKMPSYKREFKLKSKKQFDTFKPETRFKRVTHLDRIIYRSARIHQLYIQYQRAVQRTLNATTWWQHPLAQLFIAKQNTKTWHIIYSYTSPKGRNHYANAINVSIEDVIPDYLQIDRDFGNKYNKFGVSKAQVLRERSKLTKKLRYQVLKRDHYQCVICGRGAKDGVKLHVDHIKPVARGGKTTLNNLRTLCADCNLGKSSSYDPKYKYAK